MIFALLSLAGLALEDLSIANVRRRRQKLVNGSDTASHALSSFWTQEGVDLSLIVENQVLAIDLMGSEGHRGPPSERSPGFLWFLRFVLSHLSDDTTDTYRPKPTWSNASKPLEGKFSTLLIHLS